MPVTYKQKPSGGKIQESVFGPDRPSGGRSLSAVYHYPQGFEADVSPAAAPGGGAEEVLQPFGLEFDPYQPMVDFRSLYGGSMPVGGGVMTPLLSFGFSDAGGRTDPRLLKSEHIFTVCASRAFSQIPLNRTVGNAVVHTATEGRDVLREGVPTTGNSRRVAARFREKHFASPQAVVEDSKLWESRLL